MIVYVRLYKRFDLDLIALHNNGYNIQKMIKQSIIGFAKKQVIRFNIEQLAYFNLNEKHSIYLRISIPSSETDAITLLKKIKHGYRCSFVKTLLREALSMQNIAAYFSTDEYIPVANELLRAKKISDVTSFSTATITSSTIVTNPEKKKKTKKKDTPVQNKSFKQRPISAESVVEIKNIEPDEITINEKSSLYSGNTDEYNKTSYDEPTYGKAALEESIDTSPSYSVPDIYYDKPEETESYKTDIKNIEEESSSDTNTENGSDDLLAMFDAL